MAGPLARLRFMLDHRWSPPRMSDYLDGDLRPDDRARIERHTGECPECRALLESLMTMVGALAGLRDHQGAPVAATVLASVRGALGEPRGD